MALACRAQAQGKEDVWRGRGRWAALAAAAQAHFVTVMTVLQIWHATPAPGDLLPCWQGGGQ